MNRFEIVQCSSRVITFSNNKIRQAFGSVSLKSDFRNLMDLNMFRGTWLSRIDFMFRIPSPRRLCIVMKRTHHAFFVLSFVMHARKTKWCKEMPKIDLNIRNLVFREFRTFFQKTILVKLAMTHRTSLHISINGWATPPICSKNILRNF